jgi:hypothetical protein
MLTCPEDQVYTFGGPDPDHPDQPDQPDHPEPPLEHPAHPIEPGLPAVPDPALPSVFGSFRAGFGSGASTFTLHPVLRTTLLVAWAALSGACREEGADPVRTAQAFTAAVQRGDMKAVWPMLEKAASDRLAAAADKASDQVGGRRRIEPAEMLQIVDVSPTFELAQAQLVDNDGATAHVRLLGAQQESYTLTLVHEDGVWHVRIPIPSP